MHSCGGATTKLLSGMARISASMTVPIGADTLRPLGTRIPVIVRDAGARPMAGRVGRRRASRERSGPAAATWRRYLSDPHIVGRTIVVSARTSSSV
jgi:hypothetical protein